MAKKRRVSKRTQEVAESGSNTMLYAGIGIGAVILIGLGVLLALSLQPEEVVQIDGIQFFTQVERTHDESISYVGDPLPPAGGIHSPVWQNCGIYDTPILAKNAVHSLEHGAVWITYHHELPQDQIDSLKDQVGNQSFMLLSPWENQAAPIVLSAWGIQLQVDSPDDERIEQFIDEYRLGRQTPEPGATCASGIGEPNG